MTNEPPPDDGEELVEADLPGMDGGASVPGELPDPLPVSFGEQPPAPFEDAQVREAIETTISPESRLRQPPEPDPTNDSEGPEVLEGDDLVEADIPTTSSTPDPVAERPASTEEVDPLEAVDRAVEEWGGRLDEEARARREERLQGYRDEYGPDVDAEAMLRHDEGQRSPEPPPLFERVLPSSLGGKILTVILAGLGSVVAIVAATAFLGGSGDDDATGLPSAATAAAAVATDAPTEVATIPRLPQEIRLEQLAFEAVAAMADADGDLWLTVGLEEGIAVDPDTLAFVYAFAIGAALQTDGGYNGFYYSVTDGATYGEAVFGSPDFPRTSTTFSASYQIAQPELWITEDGRLAIHLPGDASGNGLDASLFGPDSMLIAGISALEEEGGTAVGGFNQVTLGEIATVGELPLASWVEIEPDQQPLQLNVPDTSNQN